MTVLTEPAAIEPLKPSLPEFQSTDTADKILSGSGTTKICFVCTGNTCRSPMAMALYNHLFKKTDSYAVSLGLYPMEGESISENALEALVSIGVTPSPDNRFDLHKAHAVSESKLCGCDKIIGMTEAHTLELIYRFPRLASRILTMPRPVSDPYGGDIERYCSCLREIESGIKELFVQ
ncbi:MAG: hypothetical protein E7591_08220 [Ruminococcaceae bacterium]|nr:hypothetical protein [Oscillospiraceae bacterium]